MSASNPASQRENQQYSGSQQSAHQYREREKRQEQYDSGGQYGAVHGQSGQYGQGEQYGQSGQYYSSYPQTGSGSTWQQPGSSQGRLAHGQQNFDQQSGYGGQQDYGQSSYLEGQEYEWRNRYDNPTPGRYGYGQQTDDQYGDNQYGARPMTGGQFGYHQPKYVGTGFGYPAYQQYAPQYAPPTPGYGAYSQPHGGFYQGQYGGPAVSEHTGPVTGSEQQRRRGPHLGVGPRGYKRSDERIAEDVNQRLTDHDEIDAQDINVKCKDGEITLTGTVTDRRTKRLAEDCLDNISGVHDVNNQLRVKRTDDSGKSQRETS